MEESAGGRGLARFKLKTWQCDELSARRSIIGADLIFRGLG